MTTKSFALVSVIGLATICGVQAQSPTPAESPATGSEASASVSPAGTPKAKRVRKKAQTGATASPAASPTTSASPAKFNLGDLFKPKTSASASPAAANAAAKATKTGAAMNATPAPGGGHGLVWVNTQTHVYHKEGSRLYGKTKKGKYVSEADAIKEGDRASKQ